MPRTPLTDAQIADALMELPGWELKSKQIVKVYTFKTYMDGVEFVNGVAKIAEASDHHPDILLSFRKVKVSAWTHSCGNVSKLDVDLAREVEKLFETY